MPDRHQGTEYGNTRPRASGIDVMNESGIYLHRARVRNEVTLACACARARARMRFHCNISRSYGMCLPTVRDPSFQAWLHRDSAGLDSRWVGKRTGRARFEGGGWKGEKQM